MYILIRYGLLLVGVCIAIGSSGQHTSARAEEPRFFAGTVHYSFTPNGSGLGLGLRFDALAHARRYSNRPPTNIGLELTASAGWSNVDFTRKACLVTSPDTIALLTGSQFYLGTDHREANLSIVETGEASFGIVLAAGSRVRFSTLANVGARLLTVTSAVDQSITPEAERRRVFLGCGAYTGREFHRNGAQALAQGVTFKTNTFSALAEWGVGAEMLLRHKWRLSVYLKSRHYFYADATFEVRDTRTLNPGSAFLRLADQAPRSAYRLQSVLSIPLF